ncbi:MAG: UDP-glucose/GDP-mannose dehydrogenase family protein [Dehalococcoidia bacterium]|nr:MAG: UDP-glucose/GDP-mannose dehydrogenase family protein [Dehalococcoidia bacterium]
MATELRGCVMRREEAPLGVMGAGVVGGALLAHLRGAGRDVRVYDPPKGFADIGELDAAGIVFVCVPTPYTPHRGFDDRHLLRAASAIRGEKIVVVKSTVLPGTTAQLQERFPQHRFLFNPEFLREATAVEDFANPDRQIVGHTPRSAGDAQRVLELLPRAPFELICPAEDAEMAKYVANSFLAVKVSYANEIFDLCERLGTSYGRVRDIVAADLRIGASHTEVFDSGYRGYGGKCLPKDSKSLLDLARSAGIQLQVLAAADAVNGRLTGERAPVARPAAHAAARPAAAIPDERAA